MYGEHFVEGIAAAIQIGLIVFLMDWCKGKPRSGLLEGAEYPGHDGHLLPHPGRNAAGERARHVRSRSLMRGVLNGILDDEE